MNRNQRILGRMHQNGHSDRENKKQERQDRSQRPEIQERADRQERYNKSEKQERVEWEKTDTSVKNSEKQEGQLKFGRHNRSTDIEEVFPPRSKINSRIADRFAANKCCYAAPSQEDFGQLTDVEYRNILEEQYGFNPLRPETIDQLRKLRKANCNSVDKVQISSQRTCNNNISTPNNPECKKWHDIDSIDNDHQKIGAENIHISETPHIKIIVKKFSRFKKNYVELRKLEEKVVCVEYDVYLGEAEKPRQKLRAFFSIKPNEGNEQAHQIPSTVKNNLNISESDLKQLNEKEIEMIDGKITENKPYLDDLKSILKRKQAVYAKKNKESLDLMSLYAMAKRESRFSNTFLTTEELKEMKELILNNCASSLQGICRRTVKNNFNGADVGVISQSIMSELLKEN